MVVTKTKENRLITGSRAVFGCGGKFCPWQHVCSGWMFNSIQGLGIYDVKGSVPVLFCKLHSRGEREAVKI